MSTKPATKRKSTAKRKTTAAHKSSVRHKQVKKPLLKLLSKSRLLQLSIVILVVALAGVLTTQYFLGKSYAFAPTQWLVKGQDLNAWDPTSNGTSYPSIGLAATARQDNISLPYFRWILCGTWNNHVYGQSDYTTCTSRHNETLVVENFFQLQNAINDGLFTKLDMHQAMYDIESWAYTPPRQSNNPAYWIGRAVRLAKAHRINLIISPGGKLNNVSTDVDAVKAGAWMVAVQSQGWGWDSHTSSYNLSFFESRFRNVIYSIQAAAHNAHSNTFIMAGLATNTPNQHPVWLLRGEYNFVNQLGITRIWINADNWQGRNMCNNSQGSYGCPQIGVKFLRNP